MENYNNTLYSVREIDETHGTSNRNDKIRNYKCGPRQQRCRDYYAGG